MEFQVNTNNVILSQIDQVESGEYNVTECNFTFSSEFESLTKKAVFTGEDGTAYLQTIVDGKCSIPSEILETSQVVQIGVYAYAVENKELILRYSPEPTDFFIHEGSYKEAQNSTPPTPSEVEQLQAQITSNKNDIEEIQGDVVDINQDIVDIKAEQITQNENIQTNANNISTINEQISDINETITNLETNKANVTDLNALTERVSTNERDIDTIDGHISDINQNIDDLEQDLTNYSLITETGSQINLNINSSNFQMTAILKDKNGNVIHTSNVIDLPLETMVVGASYDNVTKEVVLTLQNGTTLRFSVADLVSGLVSTDQLTQVLSNYYNKNEVDALIPDLTDYVKNTDYASDNVGGVIKTNQGSFATEMYNGQLKGVTKNYTQAYPYMSTDGFITKGTLENVIAGKELINQTQLEESQALQNTEIEALQTKVEELETENENLRKASYKVKGEGTDITLENTSENKFVELGLNGNTEQEQLTGKNLFDKNIEPASKWQLTSEVYNNGIKLTSTANSGVCYAKYVFQIFSSNDMYFSFSKTGTGKINVYLRDSEGNELNSYVNKENSFIINNISSEAKEIDIRFYGSTANIGDVTIFDNIQLEIGSTATSYEPYCGGIPSTNPDFPQQIKNVTGQANVKIQNKNLLNETTFITGKALNIADGSLQNASDRMTSDFIEVKPNINYICNKLINRFVEYDENKQMVHSGTSVNGTPITMKPNAKYFRATFAIDLTDIQIEQGSTATSYVEHQEQNYPFSLKSKNLYNDNAPITEYYINNQGQFVIGTNGDTFIETIIENDIASNYVISYKKMVGISYVRFSYFNGDTILERKLLAATNNFVTTPSGTTKIYIHTDKRDTKYFEDLQIEAGTTATEYESFYDIKAMQGTQLLDDGIHQKRKKKILDGTENFGIQNGCFTFNLDDINADINNNKIVCKSNYYKGVVTNYRGSINNFEIAKARGATTQVAIKDNRFTTTADFKANLAELYANGIPVIVEYELAETEEEIIPYNETQQAQYNAIKEAISYYEQTNISGSSDELSPIITATAVGDLNLILNTMQSKIDLLEG